MNLLLPLIPLVGAILVGLIPTKSTTNTTTSNKSAGLSLIISLVTLLVGFLLVTLNYTDNTFITIFILLTVFLFPVSILSTMSSVFKDIKAYYVSLLVLESILIIVFYSSTLFEFYCTFELSLVPLFILIALFGGINRYRAAFILFIYTLAGSLFILIAFIYIIIKAGGSSNIDLLTTLASADENEPSVIDTIVFIALFFSLAVKTPLVPFHV